MWLTKSDRDVQLTSPIYRAHSPPYRTTSRQLFARLTGLHIVSYCWGREASISSIRHMHSLYMSLCHSEKLRAPKYEVCYPELITCVFLDITFPQHWPPGIWLYQQQFWFYSLGVWSEPWLNIRAKDFRDFQPPPPDTSEECALC
jgi:hypothetical protein